MQEFIDILRGFVRHLAEFLVIGRLTVDGTKDLVTSPLKRGLA